MPFSRAMASHIPMSSTKVTISIEFPKGSGQRRFRFFRITYPFDTSRFSPALSFRKALTESAQRSYVMNLFR
jgi:hypothetical protein